MNHFRRTLRTFWRTTVFSIFLVAAVIASSVLADLPKRAFATKGETPAVAEAETWSEQETEVQHEPEPDHPKVSARVRQDEDTDIVSEGKKVRLHVPKGALTQEVEIEIIEHGTWGPDGSRVLNVVELNAYAVQWGTVMTTKKIRQFKAPVTLTIDNDPEDVSGLDATAPTLCYLDEKSKQWIPVADSAYDAATGTITANTDHFSYYGEVENPTILGPGKVMASVAGLNSGASTSEYAIDVPPASGGFQPSISLYYNSGGVDEMKNRKAVGSWVGIGWSLGLGSICFDETLGQYLLSLDGATYYELVPDAGSVWHTTPESYYKITRSGQQWDLYDREGTHYRFGGTTDSQQYYDNSTYYRWDLSSVQDTNTANAVMVTYVQDMWTDNASMTHVRAAYPSHVTYNASHVDIQFNSSYYTTSHTEELRRDTPVSPKPKVAETRQLNSIAVKVDSSLAREYVFTYTTTDDYYSSDYGGTYYAGQHKLTSITERGSDGVSALPSTTFTYTDLEVYHYDDDQGIYTGNPGNPASLTWPFLATVSNGYGATTTFSYSRSPSSTCTHIWTREVINRVGTTPGIGAEVKYYQGYSGWPRYFTDGYGAHTWNSRFRGFNAVKVKDPANHYVWHYFYTIGGSDNLTLTGREYKTEWYDSSNQLLETQDYTWACRYADSEPMSLDSSLVGYWKLDENGGQYIYDSSGNGNTGTRGPTAAAESSDPSCAGYGRYGPALDFERTNDFVDLGDGQTLNLTDNFTLVAWVKRDTQGNYVTVLASGTGDNTSAYCQQFLLDIEPGYDFQNGKASCRPRFYMGKSSKDGFFHQNVGSWGDLPEDSNWHLLAVTFSGSTSKIYVDGQSRHQSSGTSGSRLTAGVLDRRMGSRAGGLNYMSGAIDDTRIYNRALSDAEVQSLWHQSVPFVYLAQVTDTIGSKTSRTSYEYDDYGNVIREWQDGDIGTSD